MKALSIQQPWAEAIVRGYKPVENRTWFTGYRGPLLIHAGQKWDKDGETFILDHLGRTEETTLLLKSAGERRGGIVGRAMLTDCVIRHDSPWFFGKYGFVIEYPEAFADIIKCRGHLSLFNVTSDIRAALPSMAGRAVAP
ncbi:ASCH domain-containing protein [Nisaea sp.]|uniref:ASCH domain-containing protein n=1 Tax=Nisaea sp. TaxID=2024842 RepID=UPI0032998987